MHWCRFSLLILAIAVVGSLHAAGFQAAETGQEPSSTTLRGKIICGYQGWFRCPGDACGMGWIHYSRDPHRFARGTLTFEMWPVWLPAATEIPDA